jgi:hypothetical protein
MNCTLNQVGVATASQAHCGELVITAANGKRSIDTVMVTIGGRKPMYIAGEQLNAGNFGAVFPNSLQTAIDNAAPGDLIIVGPGTYTEMLLMWKPVRLQGVSAATTIINANAQPAGRLDPWRRQVNCLFGLGLNGQQIGATVNGSPNPYDATGTYTCPTNWSSTNGPGVGQAAVDPIPLEPIIGWDATLNGNLSEMLQEPTLMGAFEGAAISVLAKGMENYQFDSTSTVCSAESNGGCIQLNSCLVNFNTTSGACTSRATNGRNIVLGDCNPAHTASGFYVSNFLCNPSRIDGLQLTNSSQGGGALFVHGWNHNLEISNNRITGNAGTLTGGITLGQAEVPDPTYVTGANGIATATPLGIQTFVSMHNNSITFNTSYGDELNSSTPSAGGGVTVNAGSDDYNFSNNLVCGNLSTGDGGGMTHFGLSMRGKIAHNAFIFNQSTNPTLTTNGGGLIVEGNAPDGTLAEASLVDLDAGPSLSDGAGSGIVVDANLIMGNTAESGEGGGLRLQNVNGNDILNNPSHSSAWYKITVTNNIIANNVAGWEGGGVSIQDAVNVDFRNNTVVSNDTTATAGVLFDTIGAPLANTAQPNCNPQTGVGCANDAVTTSTFMAAGLVTHPHSLLLSPAFTDNAHMTCPAGGGYANKNCSKVSLPTLNNDIFFRNRTFFMTTSGSPSVVVLTPPLSQPAAPATSSGVVTGGTGACPNSTNYWDIGVYGDTSAVGGNPGGYRMNPHFSILSSIGPYTGLNNMAPASASGLFNSMYCNGARVPPEIGPTICHPNPAAPPGTGPAGAPGCTYPGALGITVPPGVTDGNPFYANFTLTPAATVDEGNNWVNMFYGPLTLVNPTIARGAATYNNPLGDYRPGAASTAVGKIPSSQAPPATDFFGNARPGGATDVGAVQQSSAPAGRIFPTQP